MPTRSRPRHRRLDDVVHHVGDPARQHAAVGVAQRGHLGAGLEGGAHHLQGVVAVVAVAVEEVLRVEEDPLPLGAQVGDGVADHREVLLERRTQGQLDVPVVRLRHEGDHPCARLAQGRDQGVVGRGRPGPPGRTERRELRVLEVQLLAGAAEELGVLRVRARPAALDEADPEPVDLPRDGQLVGDGEVEPLLLRAVAQRRVVDVEQVAGHRLVSHRGGPKEKTSRGDRRSARRGPSRSARVALGNDDAAVLHGAESATDVQQAVRRPGMRPTTPTGWRPEGVRTARRGRGVPHASSPSSLPVGRRVDTRLSLHGDPGVDDRRDGRSSAALPDLGGGLSITPPLDLWCVTDRKGTWSVWAISPRPPGHFRSGRRGLRERRRRPVRPGSATGWPRRWRRRTG